MCDHNNRSFGQSIAARCVGLDNGDGGFGYEAVVNRDTVVPRLQSPKAKESGRERNNEDEQPSGNIQSLHHIIILVRHRSFECSPWGYANQEYEEALRLSPPASGSVTQLSSGKPHCRRSDKNARRAWPHRRRVFPLNSRRSTCELFAIDPIKRCALAKPARCATFDRFFHLGMPSR